MKEKSDPIVVKRIARDVLLLLSKPPKKLTSFWVRDYTATQKGMS